MKALTSNLKKNLFIIAAICAFAFVLFTANSLSVKADDTSMSVYGIYLGDYGGDATLVESRGEYLLMDLGSVNSYNYIADFLHNRGIADDTPISLYFSHLHSDHTGGFASGNGLDRFLKEFNVQTLYLGDIQLFPETNEALLGRYAQIENLCAAAETQIVYLSVSSTFSFGDVTAEIIGPVGLEDVTNDYYKNDEDEESSSGDETLGLHNRYVNNLSLIARLTCGNTVFLTTGDAGKLEEEMLYQTYWDGLKADIYKLGHHGNQGSSTEEFLSYVRPAYSFGLNSGKTSFFTDGTSGLTYRKTYRARLHAAEYGIVYMVGDEGGSVCYRVVNDDIQMYTDEAEGFAAPLTGLLKLKGGIPYPADRTITEDDPYWYSYYYLDSSGRPLTGVTEIDGKLYYFGEGGCREGGHYASDTGQYVAVLEHTEDHSDRRVFDENDGSIITGWYTEPGTGAQQYYDLSSGIMYRGVSVIDGKEYLISDAGTLQTKTWKQFDAGNWKFYGKYGTVVTGWLSNGGEKYYLDPSTGYRVTGIQKLDSLYYLFSEGGKLQTNVWKTDDQTGGKMYFGSDGARVKGWLDLDGARYYCDKTTGYRLTGVQTLGTKTYLFSDGGKLQTNVWKKDDTGKRYFGETGAMAKGWITYGGDEYFLDKTTGYMLTGVQTIGTKTYLFSGSGKLQKNVWKSDETGRRYFGKYGSMVTGWLTYDGEKYFLDKSTGYMLTGVQLIGTRTYLLSVTGKLQKNVWKVDDKGRRYFGKAGSMVTGWLSCDGEKYYLDKSTGYAFTGIRKIGTKTYLFAGSGRLQTKVWKNDGKGYMYFGKAGSMVTGWLTLSGNTFYLDPTTGYRVTGTVKIDGKTYTFTKGGILKG